MPRITIKQDDQKQRRAVSDAQKIFIMHCKLKNLTPYTIKYYEKNGNVQSYSGWSSFRTFSSGNYRSKSLP